jgi:hypothetical protein
MSPRPALPVRTAKRLDSAGEAAFLEPYGPRPPKRFRWRELLWHCGGVISQPDWTARARDGLPPSTQRQINLLAQLNRAVGGDADFKRFSGVAAFNEGRRSIQYAGQKVVHFVADRAD